MLQDSNAALLAKGITWLARRKLGLSFLLGFASWIALALLFSRSAEGSLVYRFVAEIDRPGWRAGEYVARIFFGNDPQHRADAALMGMAGVLVTLTAFWYVIVSAVHWMRSNKAEGQANCPVTFGDDFPGLGGVDSARTRQEVQEPFSTPRWKKALWAVLIFSASYLLLFVLLYYLPRGERVPFKPAAWIALAGAAFLLWKQWKRL